MSEEADVQDNCEDVKIEDGQENEFQGSQNIEL